MYTPSVDVFSRTPPIPCRAKICVNTRRSQMIDNTVTMMKIGRRYGKANDRESERATRAEQRGGDHGDALRQRPRSTRRHAGLGIRLLALGLVGSGDEVTEDGGRARCVLLFHEELGRRIGRAAIMAFGAVALAGASAGACGSSSGPQGEFDASTDGARP